MADPTPTPSDPAADTTDEFDTEGQAFKWTVVQDPSRGRQLRQSWTPDDPKDVMTSKDLSAKDRTKR